MAKLIITAGPDRGKEFPLGQTQTVGRLNRNEIAINDDGASRQHARITRRDGRYYVVDLNSKNGITVNGERVRKTGLEHGDELIVGNTTFRFEALATGAHEVAKAGSGESIRTVGPDPEIAFGGQGSDGSGRVVTSMAKRRQAPTRTTLLWLRGDFAQVGGLYKTLLVAGVAAVIIGLGYLAFNLAAG